MLFSQKQHGLLPYVPTSYVFTHLFKICIYLTSYLIIYQPIYLYLFTYLPIYILSPTYLLIYLFTYYLPTHLPT
jgi:hypothetical protein